MFGMISEPSCTNGFRFAVFFAVSIWLASTTELIFSGHAFNSGTSMSVSNDAMLPV